MSSDAIYRDTLRPARLDLAHQLEDRRRELGRLSPLAAIYRRRVARMSAGATTAIVMVGCFSLSLGSHVSYQRQLPIGPVTTLLLGSWVAGALVYLPACWFARRRFSAQLATLDARLSEEESRGASDPVSALQRLTVSDRPIAAVRARIKGIEAASIGWPLVAGTLAVPLTLHFLVAVIFGLTKDFDVWIWASVIVVGHVHLLLVGFAGWFARRLRSVSSADLLKRHLDGRALAWAAAGTAVPWIVLAGFIHAGAAYFALDGRALAWAAASTAVPSVVLAGFIDSGAAYFTSIVATVLVLATGVAFLPVMYGRASRLVCGERADLTPGSFLVKPCPRPRPKRRPRWSNAC